MSFILTQDRMIGRGNTAEVFDIGDNRVLKLFRTGAYSQGEMEREFQNALLAERAGLPVPKAHSIVPVGERTGIIYDKAPGETLLELIFKTGDVETYTLKLAALHKWLLDVSLPSVKSCKKGLRYKIERTERFPLEGKAKLLKLLDSLPDGDSLCHDDFHFGNVLWDGKQTYLIDLMDICKGNRNFDIARTLYLTEFPQAPENIPNRENFPEMQKLAADIYLREMGAARDELEPFLIIAAARSLTGLKDDQAKQQELTLQYLRSKKIPVQIVI